MGGNYHILITCTILLTQGLQVYTQVFDDDSGTSENEFVDTFSIDVEQIPVGEETRPQVFTGTFGFAFIEMSFKVECSSGYTGDLCEVNMRDVNRTGSVLDRKCKCGNFT